MYVRKNNWKIPKTDSHCVQAGRTHPRTRSQLNAETPIQFLRPFYVLYGEGFSTANLSLSDLVVRGKGRQNEVGVPCYGEGPTPDWCFCKTLTRYSKPHRPSTVGDRQRRSAAPALRAARSNTLSVER